MARNSFTLLDGRAVLSVTGEDRAGFLQGLVSNDTAKLAPGGAVYAALLTAQGRYLHDFIMTAAEDAIWLDCEAARLADLQRRLAIYKLRAKVALAARPDLAVAAIWGPDPPEIGVADPRLAALGRRLVAPRDGLAATLVAAGLEPADFAAYDRHRLALGIPDGSRDLPVEKALLLAQGLLYRPGADRPDQVSRPRQEAAVSGADRGRRTRTRHGPQPRRARGRRDALEPRRDGPRPVAAGHGRGVDPSQPDPAGRLDPAMDAAARVIV